MTKFTAGILNVMFNTENVAVVTGIVPVKVHVL